MMKVDVVRLPQELQGKEHVFGRAVVVFDVLRATTSMVTALASGALEVRVFDSLETASRACNEHQSTPRLLAGERKCLRPDGFDLGNSPGDFADVRVRGKTIFLSTTNGTRAIVAAQGAKKLMAAALVNARATAEALRSFSLDVTLLCAGTNAEIAPEDMIGAGAVAEAMGSIERTSATIEAIQLFQDSKTRLVEVLRSTKGGQNVVNAGLARDIDFAAQLNLFDIAVEVSGEPPVARRIMRS
jgi:2-phosphosulfolactate phosphatase